MKPREVLIKSDRVMLRCELKEYEKTFSDLTSEEEIMLREWVKDGNSVYANPYLYSDDRGRPLDFINTIRIDAEMFSEMMNPTQIHTNNCCSAFMDNGDELPF